MKGISTIIGALIILMITLGLGGLAYTFISGTATQRIATILEMDGSTTTCDSFTNAITVSVRNSGAAPLSLGVITISGSNSLGVLIPDTACDSTPPIGNVTAGGRATCENTVTGTDGNNNIRIAGGGSSAAGVIFCP